PGALHLSETDLTVTLGGATVALVRGYDSLERDAAGRFGPGWRLVNRDVDVQIDAALTGREEFGVYGALRLGGRLSLTLPTGERAGFTFRPVLVNVPGLPPEVQYFEPAWQADDGVTYHLDSVATLLVRGGDFFYDQATGQPYNPANPAFAGADYTLTAPDGSRDLIDAVRGVIEHDTPAGQRLFIGDSGISAATGETLRFVHDAPGRLSAVHAPDGQEIEYIYDDAGRLSQVIHRTAGTLARYGYRADDPTLLSVAARAGGS